MRPAKRRPGQLPGLAWLKDMPYVVNMHSRVLRQFDDPDDVVDSRDDGIVPGE